MKVITSFDKSNPSDFQEVIKRSDRESRQVKLVNSKSNLPILKYGLPIGYNKVKLVGVEITNNFSVIDKQLGLAKFRDMMGNDLVLKSNIYQNSNKGVRLRVGKSKVSIKSSKGNFNNPDEDFDYNFRLYDGKGELIQLPNDVVIKYHFKFSY